MQQSKVDTSDFTKCDSFLNSQKSSSEAVTNLSEKDPSNDGNSSESEQTELRKTSGKKISFKIKKNPSLCRRNIEGQKKSCIKSNHVAQLTQKFNNMVTESHTINKPTNFPQTRNNYRKHSKSDIYKANQTNNTKHNIKVLRKPSVQYSNSDKTFAVIKAKSVTKEINVNLQPSQNNLKLFNNGKITTATKDSEYLSKEKKLRGIENNSNIVQTTIEIFERKTSLNESNVKETTDVKLGTRKEQSNSITSKFLNMEQDVNTKIKDTLKTNQVLTDETDQGYKSRIQVIDELKEIIISKVTHSDTKNDSENKKVQLNLLPPRRCDSMYETVSAPNNLDTLRSRSEEVIAKFDRPIKPNNSFLWRCKTTTKPADRHSIGGMVSTVKTDQIAPKLPPKPTHTSSIIETYNPQYKNENFISEINIRQDNLLEGNVNDLKNCDKRIYEKLGTDEDDGFSIDENIYEIMSSAQLKLGEEISAVNLALVESNTVSENVISNCYETIYTKDYKTLDNESIYESVYESTINCSNRDSLISSEQNTNSLYGKTLWEPEDDDNSTYKAVSDISDEWMDITDNEDEHQMDPDIVIIREKQRCKKYCWSQHLREQWAKSKSPVLVTVDNESDHHYESLYTTYEQQDGDYDSFESDSGSEQSINKLGLDEKYGDMENNQLPKPPNTPYGIIKFAGKHMRKLKRRSIDLSKSLTRMTKRISRTDPSLPISTEEEKSQPSSPKNYDFGTLSSVKSQTISKNSSPKNAAIYQNVEFRKSPSQKSPSDQEKERLSFLKRIRRSMSMSAESALELTSNLMNKPRSTFYLTETIDIDKDESDVILVDSSKLSKSNVIRPKSPPPPAPVKNPDQKDTSKSTARLSIYTKSDVENISNLENERKSTTCWYAEIGLYQTPATTPSTSTAENSGSATSNILTSSDFINHIDSEDYYNMKNNDYNKEDINEYDERKSNQDESLTNVTPDIQLLLQDEPLYQFYDAAVLESVCHDGTFESETDNYEEVDEENSSEVGSNVRPSAMDLVLPNKDRISFTKTLWCEIPEVIQSSVLSRLSPRQKKLQEAKFEIITSEASYLNSLNVLNNHFASSIRKCDYINEKEWEMLFGKIEIVRICSERLLQEMEKCWEDNILLHGICDVIQKQAEENFNVYIPYCENQILLGDTLKQIMERPGFKDYLRQLETSSSCQFLTLYSFLMLPMQRITRWPLLVDAVLKRLSQTDPEYLVCQYTLASLNKIVSQCNEAARKKEREIELQKISSQLEFSDGVVPIDIFAPNRWLIRSGAITNMQPKTDDSKMTFGRRFNKFQLHLYLFNDLFLVTKEKSNNIYSILHHCPRNLVELSHSDVPLLAPKKDGYEKNLLFLTILENQDGKIVEFMLSCSKESDKERWVEAITPPKSEDPEETLYECWDCPQVTALHNYSSIQPDELSLSRGDVINVLRKMGDGWYHGERIRDGQTGWFPANYVSEIVNPHVRARNLKQRYRLLAFSENYLKSN